MEEITIKDSLKITPLNVSGEANAVQLVLNGYLDTYNSPDFQSHINAMINSGVQTIIFNCNGLNYISSTGIGAFTAFLKLLKQKKGDMALFGLQKKVIEVFQLLGFTKFFKISANFEEALNLVKSEKAGAPSATPSAMPAAKPSAVPRAPAEQAPAETMFQAVKPPAHQFPLLFNCPHCGKRLKTGKPGRFRCSACKGIISIDESGTVK